VEFEPTIPVFDRAKTVHALDPAATVMGVCVFKLYNYFLLQCLLGIVNFRWHLHCMAVTHNQGLLMLSVTLSGALCDNATFAFTSMLEN
jgi:hypothetical protein